MRILIADRLLLEDRAALDAAGIELVEEPTLDADGLPAAMHGVDVLVVRSTAVSEHALSADPTLSLVVRAGAGTDNIDVAAASERGILVANVPGRNAAAVAELTMALLLAIDRRIVDATNDLRDGRWEKARYSVADGILGKAIGVYGVGNVGLEVAERAAAMGMTVHALDRPRDVATSGRLDAIDWVPAQDLMSMAHRVDVLSLHVPLAEATNGIVDAEVLAALGDTGILLNTARGELVDPTALVDAMDRGLRVGLDVFVDEPRAASADFDAPVAAHPNLVATPHIGASTTQAQRAVAAGVREVLLDHANGVVSGCVNLRSSRERAATLVVRHHDRPGVLASVLDVLRADDVNVEHMENRIFEGSTAAIAMIDLTGDDLRETLCDVLDGIDGVIATRLRPTPS